MFARNAAVYKLNALPALNRLTSSLAAPFTLPDESGIFTPQPYARRAHCPKTSREKSRLIYPSVHSLRKYDNLQPAQQTR